MKLAALALLLCSSARALLGFGSHPIVVLWMPSETFTAWDQVDQLFERYPELRLTVGLAPESVPAAGRKIVARWIENGRLEPALRIQGDPILPMIAEHPAAPRPEDPLGRVAAEREKFKEAFGVYPKAFAPGAGAVDAAVIAAMRPMAMTWAAVGDYPASTSTWAAVNGCVLAPLRPAANLGRELTPESLSLPSYSEAAAFVVDEADGLVPDGSFLRLLKGLADRKPSNGWATVGETIKDRRLLPAPAGMPWPNWLGELDRWAANPDSQAAWRLYGDAAKTIERYQNSGQADLKLLESATDELYAAQASRYYRPGAGDASTRELRSHLIAVYRTLRQTAPESLYAAPSAGDAKTDETSTDVHYSQGPTWLEFDNPGGSLSLAPEGAAAADDGLPPADLWKLKAFRVESSEDALALVYRVARLGSAAAAPVEMGSLLLQTYIDINNVLGAGATTLLDGRDAFIQARDAWEYAVTVSAWGAFLVRSNPLGKPLSVGRLGIVADPKSGEVRVTIPSSYLRGNPSHWGYVVLAMAVDPATTAKPPAKPLATKSGPILGLLAPLEQQKAVLSSKAAGRRRLAALRAR